MPDLLKNLNKEQLEAVTYSNGPLLIVAGAGTGKTTVITKKIAYLIGEKIARPDEILALTFTDKAAGEMQERADLLLPLGYHDMWISTFHSFCERILQQHGLDIGLPGDFKLSDETKSWMMVHSNLDQFNLEYYRPLGNPKKFISAMLKHFSRCKDELISPEEYLAYAQNLRLKTDQPAKTKRKNKAAADTDSGAGEAEISRIEEIASAFHTYQKLLLENSLLDFADLINYTLLLFNKRPMILDFYRQKFKYIMVDEFQDTNYAQYQLVKMLAGPETDLTVVGDDDQSIYKFRGASVSNILKFQNDFPKARQITLVENYRSEQEILDLAYNFIQANNPERLEIKLQIDKQLRAQKSGNSVISVLEGKDLNEELNMLAKKILEIKRENPEKTWNDFAILLRSNNTAGELLPILSQYSIPHTFVANTGLYSKPLIADLISYFSVLDNFHDSFALYRVLNFSEFRLPAQALALLLTNSAKKTLSLYEALQLSGSLPEIGQSNLSTINKVLNALQRHSKLAQEKSANEVFVEIIQDLKIEKQLEADTLENVENRELLEQFYKKIETFVQENSDKSLHFFLHLLNLEMEAGDRGQIKFDPNLGPESLKILTVHSAKGLEFEYVFLPGMVDQRFPTRSRGDQIEIPRELVKDILPEGDFHLQEERRLFYVAITRAKSRLCFSWGKDYGGAKTKKPSVFLQETKLVPGKVTSQATGKVFFNAPVKKSEEFKILPDKFSYSAIKAFEKCPLEYKYKYYLKLPSPGSAYFSFGQTIHKVFELYLKDLRTRQNHNQGDLFAKNLAQAELGDLSVLEELYRRNWIDEWYRDKKQKAEYQKKGFNLLKTFYEYTLKNPPKPKYLEQSFFLPIGDYKFTGKIDRADESPNGGIEILDYKTSDKTPEKNAKGDLDQLYIYQWAAEEYLHEEVKKMSYWYLPANKFLMEQVADKQDIQELKAKLLEIIEKIVYTAKFDLFNEAHRETGQHECFYKFLEF